MLLVNGLIFRIRSRPYVRRNPELQEGYETIVRGLLIWGSLPWLVMGIGLLSGGVDSLFEYFVPELSSPYVLGFYATIVVLLILGTYWLLLRGGAELLVRHPGLLAIDIRNPLFIKLIWIVGLGGAAAGLYFLLTGRMVSLPI